MPCKYATASMALAKQWSETSYPLYYHGLESVGYKKKGKEETFQVRTINREKENKNPSNSTPGLWLIAWLEVNYTGIKRGLQSIFSKVEFLKPKWESSITGVPKNKLIFPHYCLELV